MSFMTISKLQRHRLLAKVTTEEKCPGVLGKYLVGVFRWGPSPSYPRLDAKNPYPTPD